MVNYRVLGFGNESEYFDYFFKTLLQTNWTYEYFVNWKKVRENVSRYVKEISLLSSLSKVPSESRKEELKSIFLRYPETIPVIPSIIALREQNISVLGLGENTLIEMFDFSRRRIEADDAEKLASFCENAGIIRLFSEFEGLYAYLMGVEVGLDSNARKNRSGEIFQRLLDLLLRQKLRNMNLEIRAEDPSVKTTRSKRADFVIRANGRPRIAVECNFYNTIGSKPIETANAYIDFQRQIREKAEFSFIWITDGPAWEKMKPTVIQSFKEIDFPMNYTIAKERLDIVVQRLLS